MGDPCAKWEAPILRGAGSSCFVSPEKPDWVGVQEWEGWARLSFGQGESTEGPGVGAWCGLSPQGATEPPSLPGALCFSSAGPQDPAVHLQHQHVPAGGGGWHPAGP